MAEDGCVVFIKEGCKKELGRGSGIATKDCTVSRHQILLELQKPTKEVGLVGNDSGLGRLLVKVLGANPVCIVHIQQGLKPTGRLSDDAQEMVLLRKGEMDTLSLGDKISLSIRHPMFFTVKDRGHRMKDASSRFIERSGSIAVVPKREETLSNAEVGNQATEDDLLGKWRDRKKGKETGPSNTDGTKLLEAVGSACSSGDKEVAANEEEEGIAQAVARRQKRAYERRQQQEQRPQGEIIGRLREAGETSTVQFDEGQEEEEYNYVETEGIDLAKEFGFLVEGSEFDQYKKTHRLDGSKWVWPLSKPLSDQADDEQDNNVVDMGQHTPSSRKKLKKDEDDEEWRGEDLDEKVAVASAKKSKLVAKVTLRSHGPSSSKKVPTGGKKAAGPIVDRDPSGVNGDGDEDEEDETLGGFIVDDNEDEEDLLDDDEEEEESCDDDMMDGEEEEEEEDAQKQQKQSKQKKEEKPLCKYGKGCYRKNKEHLEQYEH